MRQDKNGIKDSAHRVRGYIKGSAMLERKGDHCDGDHDDGDQHDGGQHDGDHDDEDDDDRSSNTHEAAEVYV